LLELLLPRASEGVELAGVQFRTPCCPFHAVVPGQ
jgi:hypothetical protein